LQKLRNSWSANMTKRIEACPDEIERLKLQIEAEKLSLLSVNRGAFG